MFASSFDDFDNYNTPDFNPIHHGAVGLYSAVESGREYDSYVDVGFHKSAPEDDIPMFEVKQEDLGFNMQPGVGNFKDMAMGNNWIVLATENSYIAVTNTKSGEKHALWVSRRPEEVIHKIFLDPLGSYLLISMEHGENYFWQGGQKLKGLAKLKGVVITSVAWGKPGQGVREILIGSNNGKIFETSIDGVEKGVKLLYDLGVFDLNESVRLPICGLHFERFPSDPTKLFVMAATPTRCYQFVGGPTFEVLFASDPYKSSPSFIELPGDISYSELHFFYKPGYLQAKIFAWLTGVGVYHGSLQFGSQSAGEEVIQGCDLLPYPQLSQHHGVAGSAGLQIDVPLSLALTEFHFVLLYKERLQIVNHLSKEVVSDILLPPRQYGTMGGIAFDSVERQIWLFSDTSALRVVVTAEDRHMWKLYLERGDFEPALEYCKNDEQRDRVLTAQADSFFDRGRYELAAGIYAKTHMSFEEVCLKLINQNERDALKHFLLCKLDIIDGLVARSTGNNDADVNLPRHRTQKLLICTWLIEIYLNKLNQLTDSGMRNHYEETLEEFRTFLSQRKDCLDKKTTCSLIASHGRVEDLLFYVTLCKDYEQVVKHYIQHEEYEKALDVLCRQGEEDSFYKYSPILMRRKPFETVNAWLSFPGLNPRKLVPALMRYDLAYNPIDEEKNQAIRYLEHCVKKQGNTDPVIHNYLLAVYAKESDEPALLDFLNTSAHYDLKYALRLCMMMGKRLACIHIYSSMGLYEEAVDAALKQDITLARDNADKPDDEALQKKLWLRIARHVIEEDKDIKKAIDFVKECRLLKIEDILPYFPDFVLIDDFKFEICNSLEEYNRHIEQLKREMDDATASAENIRMDIRDLRNRYGFVRADQTCNLCSQPILAKQFYLFPCQHCFHCDCLAREMSMHMTSTTAQLVREIQTKLTQGSGDRQQLKQQLDAIIASDCLLCGNLMIMSVSEPFIGDNEAEFVSSWAI